MKNHLNTLAVFVFVTLSGLTFKGYGQTNTNIKTTNKELFKNIDSLGQDANPKLTAFESDYLNQIFARKRDSFNFTNKTIGFVTGSNGRTHSNKKRYFDLERDRIARGYSLNGGTLIIFNESEKKQSGGYDAVILYWSKVLPTRKSLIKTLKKEEKN